MHEVIFRIVLPSYLAAGLVALALKRRLVARRTGREAVRVRLFQGTDSVAGFAEAVLVSATIALAFDVALRAVWPQRTEALLAWPLLADMTTLRWAGFVLLSAGLVLYFVGLVGLGVSWRIGIDREGPGPLVTSGVFAYVRHPLYGGILLATLGMAVLAADVVCIAAAAAASAAVPLQARLEEEFLETRYPEYAAYRLRTGRFLPRWR